MGKKHCTVGFIAAGQAFADGYHDTVHPFTYDFNYCTMPGQWCQHNTKCCTKKDFLYFCVNFWAICQNSVQASFLPAEHILQTFYFCCCHSRFAFRQHRTIPALRLKHRSGGCGTASAAPRSPYRHLELCGVALSLVSSSFQRPPFYLLHISSCRACFVIIIVSFLSNSCQSYLFPCFLYSTVFTAAKKQPLPCGKGCFLEQISYNQFCFILAKHSLQ